MQLFSLLVEAQSIIKEQAKAPPVRKAAGYSDSQARDRKRSLALKEGPDRQNRVFALQDDLYDWHAVFIEANFHA